MKVIISIFGLFFLVSCDPMRRINMKNESGQEARITFHIKEDSLHKSPFFLSSDDESVFYFPSESTKTMRLSAGIGTWTPFHLRNLVDDLESMTIQWADKEIKMDKEEEIFQYLLSRRKGLGKDKIEIRIKD